MCSGNVFSEFMWVLKPEDMDVGCIQTRRDSRIRGAHMRYVYKIGLPDGGIPIISILNSGKLSA